MRRNAISSPIVAAQSCHFARWTGTSGSSATQGMRRASATMMPCSASLNSTRQRADRRDDGGRVAAGIDQAQAGGGGGGVPGAVRQALEMRHEADGRTDAARWLAGERQQRGGVAQPERGVEAEAAGGERAAHPVDLPGRIEPGRRLVAAIAGAGHQLGAVCGMAAVQDRANAEEADRGIIVEEVRQQARPEQGVQFVAEIACLALPPVKDHAGSDAASDAVRIGGGGALWRVAAAPGCQPIAVRMKPAA